MAGLTQAEVAHRAGLAQQTVAMYERGARQPSLVTLARLVAGCGVRLSWRLVPEPGLEDEPTRELLARSPLDRLEPAFRSALLQVADINHAFSLVVGGKLAARLHGANVRVYEIDLWVDPGVDLDALAAFLAAADVKEVSHIGGEAAAVATRALLLEGWPLARRDADVYLRSVDPFEVLVRRAISVPLPQRSGSLLVASPDDCIRGWHDRDLDHLALQRVLRLTDKAV
jgi:transcriptional regulator with XRE-family HTH domain